MGRRGDPRDLIEPRPLGLRGDLVALGALVVVAAYDEEGALVGSGSAAPRGDAAELMGIAVVPGARRRGLGAAMTAALVAACRDVGVRTAFLSAASDDADGVYRGVGFERHGLACILAVGD